MLHEKCIHCTRFKFKEELVLFGYAEKIYIDRPMDLIILFAKFYIYKCKFESNKPSIKPFLQQLTHRIRIERTIANNNNKYKEEWFVYEPLFENSQMNIYI